MFENKIAYWIKETGLKRTYIAKKLNITYQTLSNWCNNRSQPDLKQAYELSLLFGVKMDDLVMKVEV
jgi:putative transcriptional regulator